ncbi:hypothetical protein Leryth_001141 [Lithospermum erythrorhizon]|nr:hypothetical protein Leryth_001141 [Lithospermum erythrorhizon]
MDQNTLTTSFNLPTTTDNHHPPRRRTCPHGCDRPINVCLCPSLPSPPLHTSTRVVILHHPHEQRHKLATVPILYKCLSKCDIILGRRLKYGHSNILDSLFDYAIKNPLSPFQAIFLFPGTESLPSTEINEWISSTDAIDEKNYVLIAFDGTWKHAKEMVHASLPFLSKFAVQVCLNYDATVEGPTIFDSELTLRKEPFDGCISTMEAVARCLRVLETNGDEIEAKIVDVLRTLVKLQAGFLKPSKPRVKVLKKQKESK